MHNLDDILRLNPQAAAGIDAAREALDNIKKLRELGMAPGPALINPGGYRKTLDQLKVAKSGRYFKPPFPHGV